MTESNPEGIAIIGMAGRFPGAANVTRFWQNLVEGVESITTFTDEELIAAGVEPEKLRNPTYVRARGTLHEADYFDALFFGMTPKEAEVTDPQQRLFMEASWEALEDAGHDPERFAGAIGVYAGMGNCTYYLNNLSSRPDVMNSVGPMVSMMANEKDFLATKVAFKLNLRGPALSVNTACSTSLVAVAQACNSLLSYQCDMALAGGVSITCPEKRGFEFQDGGIVAPDGHCRAFDEKSAGTVSSDGLGVVVLKRLADALNDGDQIYAVIKGAAINNDGSSKGSFSAPSVDGQAEVIAMAHALAGFEPRSITYVEAHGTGTPLGDPIEVAGLTKAFRAGTTDKQFCAIASVKSNIGHLDTAAGVAGLIKTALALKHKQIPPSVNFTRLNPGIDFENSPFHVNTKLTEWKSGPTPRRAGVSSFGLGGTNAHTVLEEAPAMAESGPSRKWQLLLLSAKTEMALDKATSNLATFLKNESKAILPDIAYTLQTGRAILNHRRMVICQSAAEAVQMLETQKADTELTACSELKDAPVIFMFPGQGSQHVNMGVELYHSEPVFREEVDRCTKLLQPHLGVDLRQILYPQPEQTATAEEQLIQTRITQPALFVIEYALAKLWMSWGIKPQAMIGHSVGEYVAACLAGVFSLHDALGLVASRARLVQAQPGGAMLAVRLPEKELQPLLNDRLSIAAINTPKVTVVAGPYDAVEQLEAVLKGKGIIGKRLQTSHAFHSAMMDPVLKPFMEQLRKVNFKRPTIPFVSNVNARWITPEEAVDPDYWVGHVRQTVRFAEGIAELLKDPKSILIEVGPGQTLATLTRQQPAKLPGQVVLNSLAATREEELPALLTSLGKLWLAGAAVDWNGFYHKEKRRKISLPTYPFERKRYYVEPGVRTIPQSIAEAPTSEAPLSPGDTNESDVSPATVDAGNEDIEGALMAILEEVSGASLNGLNPSTKFSELGFDSLFLAQMSQSIEKKLGVKVTFRQLSGDLSSLETLTDYIQSKTPEKLTPKKPVVAKPSRVKERVTEQSWNAALDDIQQQLQAIARRLEILRNARPEGTTAAESAISDAQRKVSELQKTNSTPKEVVMLPLTDGQMELWLGTRWGEDALRALNHFFSLTMEGRLNVAALKETLAELVARHDALRITFLPDGSGQKIAPTLQLDIPVEDHSPLDEVERKGKLREIEKSETSRAFDIVNGPLFRARLVKLSAEQHVLLLSAHHLVLDGWSVGVLFRELSAIYSAKVRGAEANLEPAVQFGDFIKWDKAPERLEEFKKSENYWLTQFANPPVPVELPTDRPRPAFKTYRAARETLRLDSVFSTALKKACAREGCTLFTYLFASFNAWLHRLGGQTDLVVGVPATGQLIMDGEDVEGKKSLVGHCVNLLPIRSTCPGDTIFSDFLTETRRCILDAYEHQHFTFSNLVSKLNLPRDASRMPLVSVSFNVNRGADGLELHGLKTEVEAPANTFNIFDLTMDIMDSQKEFRIDCRYNSDLYDAGTIRHWLSHWQTLLEASFQNPGQPISRLPLLNEADLQHLLNEWNNTQMEYPRNKCVQQLVEEQAGRTPDKVAVKLDDQSLTYRELNQRANRLAHHLRKRGIGPDCLVGLCVERSLEMMIGLLGILKAGGAYLPLDPHYPKDRLAFILQDSKVNILLTQQSLFRELPQVMSSANGNGNAQGPEIICLDPHLSGIAERNEENPAPNATPDQPAYVLYTSGSTGKPKGVKIPHRALSNFLASTKFKPGLCATDVLMAVTTLSFDIAGLELWLPLIVGAIVILVRKEVAGDGKALTRLLTQSNATVMQATPATWRMLLEAGWMGKSNLKILCGGEAWSEDLVKQLLPRCSSLWNMYGPTETTIWSAAEEIKSAQTPMIGRPLANTQFYVLDAWLQPVPIGIPGELHIGGDGLALGYLNREKLTSEKFIANPFSTEPGARLYKTGDLVRYRSNGRIEFLGRMDNQVKIRGYRIELGEIETVLRQHPAVSDGVVIAGKGGAGEQRLVGYVTPKQGFVPDTAEIRNHLKEHLPDYMIPQVFVILDALPLTPNGKVDRKALPEPAERTAAEECSSPTDPTQVAVAEVWCEVLKLKQVGIHDNFFELGGDSLTATQLISRLAMITDADIGMREVFEFPTVASMSEWLDSAVNVK